MFRRILKIASIVMLSGIGVIGATAGVLAIKGEFSNKKYKPNALTFESTEMYVDNSMDDLSFKVFADSTKVNVTDITLHILEGEELIEITSDETNIDEEITFRLKELSDISASSSKGKVVIEARNSDNTVSTYPDNLTIYVDRLTEAVSIQDTNDTNNNRFYPVTEPDGSVTYYNGKIGETKTITINVGDEYQLTPLFYPAYSNHPISEKDPKIVEYYMKDEEELNGTLYTDNNGVSYVRGEHAGDFVIKVATYASYSIQDELEASRPAEELEVERDYRLNSMVVSEIRFIVKNIDVDSIVMDGSAPEFKLGETTKVVLNDATPNAGVYNLGIQLYKNGTPVEQKLNEIRFVNEVPNTSGSYLTFVNGDGKIVNNYFDINYSGSGNKRTFEITPLRYVANLSLKLTVINENNNKFEKTISNIGIDYTYVDAKINKDIIIPIGESGVGNVALADYLTVENANNTYSKVLYFVVVPSGQDNYAEEIPFDVIPRVRHNGDYLIGFKDGNNVVLDQLRCKTGSISTTQIYAVVVRSSLDGAKIYDKNGEPIEISNYIDDPDNTTGTTGTSIINLAYSGAEAVGSVVSSNHIRHKVTPVYTIGDIAIYLEGVTEDGVEPENTDPIDPVDPIDPNPVDPDVDPTPIDPVNLAEPDPDDPDNTEPDKYELHTTPWKLREQYSVGEGRPESPTLVIRDQGTINALAYALQNAKANNFNYTLSARAYNGNTMIGSLGSNEITFGELKPYTTSGEWAGGDIKDIDCYKCTLDIKNYPTLTGFTDDTVIRFFLNYSYNDYTSKAEESETINILSGAVTGISVADDDNAITDIKVEATWDSESKTASYKMYINNDTTGKDIDINIDFLAEYIHFTPEYAINQSYTYSSDGTYFEVRSNGTDFVLVFKKSGTGALTITSVDNINKFATINVNVEVPKNEIKGDKIGTAGNPEIVYASSQGLLALVQPLLTGAGIEFSIESVDVNGTSMADYTGIVTLDNNGTLSKDNKYLNDSVTVKVKASSIFAEDKYLYITLSSPVSVIENSDNKTNVAYQGTTFAIAQFLDKEITPTAENSTLIIRQNAQNVILTYKLNDQDFTDDIGSTENTILIDTSGMDTGSYIFKIYLDGICLKEYEFQIKSNVELITKYTENNRYVMKPDDSKDVSELVQIKAYDIEEKYYVSYDEPDQEVKIINIEHGGYLTVTDNTITAGWIESNTQDTYVYFNGDESLKLYIRIENDMSAGLNVSEGTAATAIDMSGKLVVDGEGWNISNITADDTNVKYIDGKLIYNAFVSVNTTVTLNVTIVNDGKKWTFDHTFTFTPLLPTISTDAVVKAGKSYKITDFISYKLTYDYVENSEIKSGTRDVTITIGSPKVEQLESFDHIFSTLATKDIISVNVNDQSSFTIGTNVGNGAEITLTVKVEYENISYFINDFAIVAKLTEELIVTYPTITDGAENVKAGDSINMFAIDDRFGSSYQRVIHGSTAKVQYLDSTYETLGYQGVSELVHIDGGVVTFDSAFMNMGSGTVTLVITTSTGRSAKYVVNVMAVSDKEYSFEGKDDGQIVKDSATLDLTEYLTIKDQYGIAITEYTVVAVDGAEYINTNKINDGVLTGKEITFQTVYSTHIIKFAIYININNNIVFVGNYSITLVPDVTVTVDETVEDELKAVKDPISYEYKLKLITDEDADFADLLTVTYGDESIEINNITCDDSDDRMAIDGNTVTFRPVASETTYHLHLYYILSEEIEKYFVIDVTVTVTPGEYFKSDVKSNINPDAGPINMGIGSECDKDFILEKVLADDFKNTLLDEYGKLKTKEISIYDKSGNVVDGSYFSAVNATTYIEYTFETSFGARQTFTFVVYPNISDKMDYTQSKGETSVNAVEATITTGDNTNGSTIKLSDYVNIKYRNENNYQIQGMALNVTVADNAYKGYLLGYDASTCTIKFAHSAMRKTFCLNIQVPFVQVPFGDNTYFAEIYKLWVTIPATYGMDAQYLVDGATCEYVAVKTSRKLDDFYNSIRDESLSGLEALHDTRLETTEGSSLTLAEIFVQTGINAIQIETSENILYNTDTQTFTYMAMSDNEYIRFYNETGLNVVYNIKIKSSVVNYLNQNYNNTATGPNNAKYEKVVYADGKINGTVLSTTDVKAWAKWYRDADYSGSVKLYWETNVDGTKTYTEIYKANSETTEIKFENLDISGYGAENFGIYNIHVLTDAGYVGVISIILVPDDLGYTIGYTSLGKTNEEIYGNIDGLDIYGNDFVNKQPRITIKGTSEYTTTLSVYTVNNQDMNSDMQSRYINIAGTKFDLKTVSQDTVIVLNVAISVKGIEVLKFRYNILVKNHLVIDMPYATNKTLDVFLNDYDKNEINFSNNGDENYAQVTLLKYSNDITSDTGYTSEYISSASLVYTLRNNAKGASVTDGILAIDETEDWADYVDATLNLTLRVATPSGEYYQEYTLIVHPSVTIVKNNWSDTGTYNGVVVHRGTSPADGGSEYEIFGFNGDSPNGSTPYKAYTMTTEMNKDEKTYTNYYLDGSSGVKPLTGTAKVKYQIVDTDAALDKLKDEEWSEGKNIALQQKNLQGEVTYSGLKVTLPYVATDRNQIVVYRITIGDITFDHYVLVSNRNIFIINQKEFVIKAKDTSFSKFIFGTDGNSLLTVGSSTLTDNKYTAKLTGVCNDGKEDTSDSIIKINNNTITLNKPFTNELRFSLKVEIGETVKDAIEVGTFGEFRIVPESTEMVTLKEYSLVRDFGYSASELGATDIKIAYAGTSPTGSSKTITLNDVGIKYESSYTNKKSYKTINRGNVEDTLYSYTYTETNTNKLYNLSKTVYVLDYKVNAFIVPQQNDINLDTIYINLSDYTVSSDENYKVKLHNYIKIAYWDDSKDDKIDVIDGGDFTFNKNSSNVTMNSNELSIPASITEQISFEIKVTYGDLTKTVTVYVNPPESSTDE